MEEVSVPIVASTTGRVWYSIPSICRPKNEWRWAIAPEIFAKLVQWRVAQTQQQGYRYFFYAKHVSTHNFELLYYRKKIVSVCMNDDRKQTNFYRERVWWTQCNWAWALPRGRSQPFIYIWKCCKTNGCYVLCTTVVCIMPMLWSW